MMIRNRERGKAKLRKGSQKDDQVRVERVEQARSLARGVHICEHRRVQHALFGRLCHFLSFIQTVYEKQEEKEKEFRLRGDSKRKV